MDTLSTFANRFKKLREERGLSQSDLAKELNISRGSVSFYEFSKTTFVHICKVR